MYLRREVSVRQLPPSKAKPETAGKYHHLDPDPSSIRVNLPKEAKTSLKKGIRVSSILIAIIPLVYVKLSISTS